MMTDTVRKIIFLICIASLPVYGDLQKDSIPKASVEIGWELVKDAVSYELEVKDAKGNIQVLLSEKNSVSAELVCGHYSVRARTVNIRKVQGVWGAEKSFDVPLKQAKQVSPKNNDKIITNEGKKSAVEFKWKSIGTELLYHISIFDEKNKLVASSKTSETQAKLDLPVGARYTWKLTTLKEGCFPDPSGKEVSSFDLIGPLSSPTLVKEEFSVKWNTPDFAKSFDYTVEMEVSKEQRWKEITSKKDSTATEFSLDRSMALGTYRITIFAKAPFREKSKPSTLVFKYTHPRSMETRLEFMGAYMPAKKQHLITANNERSGINTYLLYSFLLWTAAFYKNKGIYFQYQHGEKKLALLNESTGETVKFDFSITRSDVGFEYDYYYYQEYGIAMKLYLAREDTEIFTFSGPNIDSLSETVTLLGGEIGPKVQLFFLQLHGYFAYEVLLYSRPYRLSPYDQYGIGGFGEMFLNDYISAGAFYKYGITVYNYSDPDKNSFLNRVTTAKLGAFIRYTLH